MSRKIAMRMESKEAEAVYLTTIMEAEWSLSSSVEECTFFCRWDDMIFVVCLRVGSIRLSVLFIAMHRWARFCSDGVPME